MAQNFKYASVSIDTGDKSPIGDDEPIFVIRAQDMNALSALEAYRALCEITGSPDSHLGSIDGSIKLFRLWRRNNPESMKTPD